MTWQGCNPKALQTMMGHYSIEMTLGYYPHVEDDDVLAEGRRLIRSIGTDQRCA